MSERFERLLAARMFSLRSRSAKLPLMPDRDDPPLVRTRDDLLFPIAGTIRLHLTYLSQQQAEAVADTVLRAFKAAGLAIRRKRNQNGRNDPAHGAPA